VNNPYFCYYAFMQIVNYFLFFLGNFDCACTTARLYKTVCFCLEGTLIQMRSFQGSLLSTLSFMDSEGSPVLITLSAHYLCAASTIGFIKLWDVSNRFTKFLIRLFEKITQLRLRLRLIGTRNCM